MDYRIIYVGAQTVFGVLYLTLLILRHTNYRGQRLDKLDAVYILFIITIVLDGIWVFIDGKPEYRTWHLALEIVYLSTMACTGYVWFLYTLDLFPAKLEALRKYRYVLAIPVLMSIASNFVSLKTGWVFSVDESGTYIRGPYSICPVVLNYAYMLLGSYVALRCRKEALLTMDKRRFTVAALFPVPVLVLAGAQLLLPPGLPTMQGGVLVALLMLYGTFQGSMVTRDYLTGLPNRFAFERDLLERIRRYRPGEGAHLYLIEGDLDRFKHINDTYGHPAGDRALQLAATTLEELFAHYGAAVFRIGGDEFMMLAETSKTLDIDAISKELNAMLAQAPTSDGIELSVSLGMQEYDGHSDFRTLIEEVDKSLYDAKKSLPAAK